MKVYAFDAVVIGSGCAGYNCADWLFDFGVKNIAVITEGRTCGTSRNTGSDKQTYYKLSLCGDKPDSVRKMAKTLFAGGAMDGDIALCEAANSARCFLKLANSGVRFPTNAYGEYVGYKTDHDPFSRATSVGPYTSKRMTEVLEQAVIRKGIPILDGVQVIELLADGGKITGLLGLDLMDENRGYVAVKTANVVLATGGPAGVYYDSVYPLGHTGNSSLALNAGARFVNLSEWQYGLSSLDFRWNVSGTYQQVLPRYISIDENGCEREFLLEHMTAQEAITNTFLKGYEWPFDVRKIHGSSYIDLLVYRETTELNRRVYLDFTREPTGLRFDTLDKTVYEYLEKSGALLDRPIERLKKMNGGAVALYREHGIDLSKEPLRIAVCAQHNNGGVQVDADWQTSVRGLYACGEAAGTLGIFRPGGTALNSCQVGGLRSARHVAFLSENEPSENFDDVLLTAVRKCDTLIEKTHAQESTLSAARKKYQKAMSKTFAFLRDIPQMEKGKAAFAAWRAAFIDDNRWCEKSEIGEVFKNRDILDMQCAVAAYMTEAANRYGSRGSAFVQCGADFMARTPKGENEKGRKELLLLQKNEDDFEFTARAVKKIPKRELWFEKVWNEYSDLVGIKA